MGKRSRLGAADIIFTFSPPDLARSPGMRFGVSAKSLFLKNVLGVTLALMFLDPLFFALILDGVLP
jgi:hypothetical protein